MVSKTPYRPLRQDAGAYNYTVYQDDLLRIGLFRCRPWEELFYDDTQAQGRYVVFPHSCVYITPEGDERHVADPTVVVFYNKYQTYRRAKLSEHGDACAYFEFAPEVLREVMPHYDPAREDRPDYPFPVNVGRSDAHSYLLHRLVVAHVLQQETPNTLFVQETMIYVLQQTVENALPASSEPAPSRETRRAHADLAREAQSLLATHFHEPLTLPQIAARLHVSPYHLCRVFRRQTGRTIHQHRKDLRLRAALDHVLGGETDLAHLALALGFANHSHFTKAFRLLFNTTPSNLRDPQALRQMSKNLTV